MIVILLFGGIVNNLENKNEVKQTETKEAEDACTKPAVFIHAAFGQKVQMTQEEGQELFDKCFRKLTENCIPSDKPLVEGP